MKKIKLIIFDMDGTILDTLEDLTGSTNYALKKNGFPLRTVEEVRNFVGNGIGKLIERAVPEETAKDKTEEVLSDFKIYYAKHCADKTRPYSGICELLDRLKKEGYFVAVVSNKADFAVQDLCKQYFDGIFDYAVGEKEGIRRKPAPDTVFEVINKMKINIDEAVYVGDSDVDMQTAENANMKKIAVSWGFRDKDFLVKNGAEYVADEAAELYDFIKKME